MCRLPLDKKRKRRQAINMFLGIDELLEFVKNKGLVENLSSRELENPEGTGFDLRVGVISVFTGDEKALLTVDKRKTPSSKVLASISQGNQIVSIESGQYVLATTIERVNMPDSLVGIIRPRSTLYRSGIILSSGQVNPGYVGELTFGFYNASPYPFSLEIGARIAHILFGCIEGRAEPYKGQWQGGRVSTESIETQI
jgi:deoxycytidine triphosphate deaminase